MKILAIDTTTFLGSIALVEDDRLVASLQQGTEVTYSERLVAGIDYLKECARWKLEEIDLIAVAIGPGSFTGLRIGIATAKGLGVALSKPLKGASSLDVLAHGANLFDGIVVPVIDARRDEVYAAGYRYSRGTRTEVLFEECVCPPDVLCDRLENSSGDMILVGDGARRYMGKLVSHLPGRALVPRDAFNFPHAYDLAQIAAERFRRDGADEVSALVPNYIRHSDAEIGFKGRHL